MINFIRSAIDLIAVWFILYYLISMFKTNMKTMQLFKGVLFILIVKVFFFPDQDHKDQQILHRQASLTLQVIYDFKTYNKIYNHFDRK